MLLKALIAPAINEHGNWNTIIDRSLKIHNQQHDHSFLIIQTHHHYNNSTTHCTMRPRHADPTWRNKTQVDATVAAMLASRGYLRQYKRTTEVNNHKKKAGSWPWYWQKDKRQRSRCTIMTTTERLTRTTKKHNAETTQWRRINKKPDPSHEKTTKKKREKWKQKRNTELPWIVNEQNDNQKRSARSHRTQAAGGQKRHHRWAIWASIPITIDNLIKGRLITGRDANPETE